MVMMRRWEGRGEGRGDSVGPEHTVCQEHVEGCLLEWTEASVVTATCMWRGANPILSMHNLTKFAAERISCIVISTSALHRRPDFYSNH